MSTSPNSTVITPDSDVSDIVKKGGNDESVTQRDTQSHVQTAKEMALEKRAAKRAAQAEKNRKAAVEKKDKGNKLFSQQDYHGATLCYLDAIKLHPSNPIYSSNLAAAYLKLECNEEAEEAADDALWIDPKFLKARYRRGIARKEQNFLKAAIIDFQTIVREDPSCEDAKTELAHVCELWESGEGFETGYSSSEDDLPHFADDKLEPDAMSDTSDCNHAGNGIACRFYNHDGCNRGDKCSFSHAPDDKSVRDNLGKNVCVYYLLGTCKFGDVKCIYSHSKEDLPEGWWSNELHVADIRTIRQDIEQSMREQRALDNLLWKLRGGGSKKNKSRRSVTDGEQNRRGLKGKSTQGSTSATRVKKAPASGKKSRGARSHYDDRYEEELNERIDNFGFSECELNELVSQGVKPWDDDAWDVLDALSYY